MKLNVDAAFNEEIGTGRTGAIIRDYTGAPIAGVAHVCHSLIHRRPLKHVHFVMV